ncbi:MAG: deaminase [Armatimonadota bacterium]
MGANATIDELQDAGTALRASQGPDVLAEWAMEAARKSKNTKFVLDGIKHPAEAKRFGDVSKFYLVAIEASADRRFDKMPDRYGEDRTAFDRNDRRDQEETDELGRPVEHGQRVQACVGIADCVIWNDEPLSAGEGVAQGDQDGTVATLRKKLDRVVETIEDPPGRHVPTPEEVRMCQAYAVARMSLCERRRVGAVVTNSEGYVVAEGCNAVPEGQKSCQQVYGGCYRRKWRGEYAQRVRNTVKCECGGQLDADLRCAKCGAWVADILLHGRDLELCRAVHAEENAILQFSRFGGPDIRRGTMYTTTFPCPLCANKIVQVQLDRVVYFEPYETAESLELLEKSHVDVRHFEGFTPRAYLSVYG